MSNVRHAAQLQRAPWYAVNIDLRHWFHQLPLPKPLGRHFQLFVDETLTVCPRAVPMGWYLAPLIAQSATWAILLGSGKDDAGDPPGRKEGTLRNLTEPPGWLALHNGNVEAGGIFVILDNVFVVTPSERLAIAWRDRIRRRCTHLNVQLKDAAEVTTMRPDACAPTTFLGIDFGYSSWRTDSRTDHYSPYQGM